MIREGGRVNPGCARISRITLHAPYAWISNLRRGSKPQFVPAIQTAMLNNIIIFVLAAFVGTEILTKVPQTLHTPLMSGANAISGITVVGALVAAGMTADPWSTWIGFGALVVATINVVGGFLVTDRMLKMFGKKKASPAQAEAVPAAERTDGTPA